MHIQHENSDSDSGPSQAPPPQKLNSEALRGSAQSVRLHKDVGLGALRARRAPRGKEGKGGLGGNQVHFIWPANLCKAAAIPLYK